MKMLVNSEWLRKKIGVEPEGIDCEAGIPVESLQSIRMFFPPNDPVESSMNRENEETQNDQTRITKTTNKEVFGK